MAELEPIIVPVPLVGSPQQVYARLGAGAGTVLLESAMAMPGLSGWSWIAGPALATLSTQGDDTRLVDAASGELIERWADPFDAIQSLLTSLDVDATRRPAGLSFAGGLIGYLGYDLARFVERLPVIAAADPPLPAMQLHVCDHVLAFDHTRGQWYFCTLPSLLVDAAKRMRVWEATLARAWRPVPMPASAAFQAGPMQSRTPANTYLAQVQQVLDLIAAGDIFQANLSHRLEGTFEGDAFALYRALTAANPAPFAAYFPGDGFAIASVRSRRGRSRARCRVMPTPRAMRSNARSCWRA